MVNFWDSVKEGIQLVNRNWQLVLVRVAAWLISFIGFVIIVGIPFAVAVITIGVNFLTARPEAFIQGLKDVLLQGYPGLAVLLVAGILVYIVFAAAIWIYVLAGSFGLLGANLKNPALPFKLSAFFSEGKRLFWPFSKFYSIIGLFVILAFLLLGLSVGGAVFALSLMRESLPLLALFLGVVFSLIVFLAMVFVVVGSLVLSVFGAGIIVLEGGPAWGAVKNAWRFMGAHPRAFWGYTLLLFIYLFISLFLLGLAYPFGLIPIIGSLIVLPYQVMVSAVQRYLGLALAGTAFSFYLRSTILPMRGGGGTPAKSPSQAAPPPAETPRG
jgi:hypothetical protein